MRRKGLGQVSGRDIGSCLLLCALAGQKDAPIARGKGGVTVARVALEATVLDRFAYAESGRELGLGLAARSALAAMAEGDTRRTLLAALRRVLKIAPINTVALRRRLADASVERERYVFE